MFISDEVTGKILGTPVYISYKLIDKKTNTHKSQGYVSTYIPPLRNMMDFANWKQKVESDILKNLNKPNLVCNICDITDISDWFINKHEDLPYNGGFRLTEKR